MPKKRRIEPPEEIAAEILFLSDRTCCICCTRGKPVQLHHIDENPANNSIENLAVLCIDCHNETMIRGGFGRKLNGTQIKKYKYEWIERVKQRKIKADELASIETVTGTKQEIEEDLLNYKTNKDPELLKNYLDKIQIVHKAQLEISQTKWDTGTSSEMIQGNYDIIDFYEEVLVELATFYPKNHFNGKSPKKYFNELVSSRFLWHRLVLEPRGGGSGDTIIGPMTGGNVMEDLKRMIVNMVDALSLSYDIEEKIDSDRWREKWINEDD
ncbi:MAG: HNH endonuclease signature motif containing protein [Chrysiogenia bacterium]